MKTLGLVAKRPKLPHSYKTGKELPTIPNRLDRQFNPQTLYTHWVGDITYIRSHQGWTYLATVMDLGNREIVGYALSKMADAQLAKQALINAIGMHRPSTKGLMFHSDQGVQYCAKLFQQTLADQAKQMFEIFQSKYAQNPKSTEPATLGSVSTKSIAAEAEPPVYITSKNHKNKVKNAALILHDIGTKQERKDWVDDFKAGKIDFLFVYNMLLTGFDAKRLKKLYLGRVIRKHNLLQALTRVNRTYKGFRYGYVVDFADIRKEFDATNKAYFDELQAELGDEMDHYSHLFKSQEEIHQDIEQIKDALFRFDIENAEIFADQISQIQDRETVLQLKKVLGSAKELYNLIRLQGEYDFLDHLDFDQLNRLYRETENHLQLLNLKNDLENGTDTAGLLNRALEDVIFKFVKIGEEELVLADQLKNTLRKTREALASNFDQNDPDFVTLKEELERLFKKKNLSEVTQEEMIANIDSLNKIHSRIKELNRQNDQLRQKYQGDAKYSRIHKRIQERQQAMGDISDSERKIGEALISVKQDADEQVLDNSQILVNESYFERQMMPLVLNRFYKEQQIKLNADTSKYINHLVVAEYLKEYNTGANAW